MEGGDLMNDVLLKRKDINGAFNAWMTDDEVRIVTWRVLKALEFMHSLSSDGSSILHRDLKPDNVLLARRGPDGCGDCATAKLADLGHAKQLDGVSRTFSETVGTTEYMPPEFADAILNKSTAGYTKALDMWQAGVLIFVCFVQQYPYGGAGDRRSPQYQLMCTQVNQRILSQGLQGTGPGVLDPLIPPGSMQAVLFEARNVQGRHLMQSLLQRKPEDRPKVADALNHPWFAGMPVLADAATP